MSRRSRIVMGVGIICAFLAVLVWSATGQEQRITPIPFGPKPGPCLASDGTDEADRALGEVREVLKRYHCQLAFTTYVTRDGSLAPRIIVERLVLVNVEPE